MSKSKELYQDQLESGDQIEIIYQANVNNLTVGQLMSKIKIMVERVKELKSKGCGQDELSFI